MVVSLRGLFKSTGQGESWIRAAERFVLRVGSFVIALASAHSIRWFLSPLDGVDLIQPVMNWLVAVCVGVFGYFLTRGLAHRLMSKEQIWLYVPLCVLIEFVEVYCNFVEAFSHFAMASWLSTVPHDQWGGAMVFLALVVYSCIPLISAALAVVDMDFERQKLGKGLQQQPGAQAQAQAGAQPGAQARPQPGAQAGAQPGAQARPQARPQAGAQPGAQARPQARPQAGAQPGAQARPQARPQAGAQPGAQARPQPGAQARPQARPQADPPPGVTRQPPVQREVEVQTEAL